MKYIFLYILACLFTVNAVAQSIKPTVAVLGDSYSTFEKYIPDTNKTYYTTTDWSKTGVVNVKQTWWWQVIKKAGFKLGANDSYSGATVSYSGYNDEDYADRSFITRVPRLGNPDIILIFGGINDKLIELAQEHYPNVTLYFIISDDLKTEIVESTKVVCEHYGIKYVQLQGIEKESGHPTVKGMETIANQVLTLIK